MTEMFPRPSEFLQPQKSSAWLERAKQLAALTGDKKVLPFNFQPTSCVKLNNIGAARKLLDNLYQHIDVDKVSDTIQRNAPPVPEKQERQRFLFTVKVVIAEGLVPLDSSPSSKLDTFVTLSDEGGNRLAKTRTIYETNDPRCEYLVVLQFFILYKHKFFGRGGDFRSFGRETSLVNGQCARSSSGRQA